MELLKSQLTALEKMARRRAKGKEVRLKTYEGDDKEKKREQSHLYKTQPSVESVVKRINSWKAKIKTKTVDLQNREDNKAVALGTSKINYMDPRITVAWCKRNEVPIEKVFPGALRDKFVRDSSSAAMNGFSLTLTIPPLPRVPQPWACAVPDTFRF